MVMFFNKFFLLVLNILIYFNLLIGLSIPQAAIPICYELSCELVFPIHESIPNSITVLLANCVSNILFFLVSAIGLIGNSDGNLSVPMQEFFWWFAFGASLFAVFPAIFVREKYKRLELESNIIESKNVNDID